MPVYPGALRIADDTGHIARRRLPSENEKEVFGANVCGLSWSTRLLAMMECVRSFPISLCGLEGFSPIQVRRARVKPCLRESVCRFWGFRFLEKGGSFSS